MGQLTRKNAFLLSETLVALLISATILLGTFFLASQGGALLLRLNNSTTQTLEFEAALAVLRADLNNAIAVSWESAPVNKVKDTKHQLKINLDRFIFDPSITEPTLAEIRWDMGTNGINRVLTTPHDQTVVVQSFSETPISPSLTFVGADLWRLKVLVTDIATNPAKFVAIYPIDAPLGR